MAFYILLRSACKSTQIFYGKYRKLRRVVGVVRSLREETHLAPRLRRERGLLRLLTGFPRECERERDGAVGLRERGGGPWVLDSRDGAQRP